MSSDLPISPRYIIGVLALLITAALMWTETIPSKAGITMFIGVLAALGVFERRARKQSSGK